jgi:hypothetical protein
MYLLLLVYKKILFQHLRIYDAELHITEQWIRKDMEGTGRNLPKGL